MSDKPTFFIRRNEVKREREYLLDTLTERVLCALPSMAAVVVKSLSVKAIKPTLNVCL